MPALLFANSKISGTSIKYLKNYLPTSILESIYDYSISIIDDYFILRYFFSMYEKSKRIWLVVARRNIVKLSSSDPRNRVRKKGPSGNSVIYEIVQG